MRKIAMYRCNNCSYHFGAPHYIPDSESESWKPKRCTACGSRDFKFDKIVKI